MEWCKELETFSKVATAKPHVAYAAIMFELRHRYTYCTKNEVFDQGFLQ